VLGLLLVINIQVLTRFCGFFRHCRTGGLLRRVMPDRVTPTATMAGTIPPVVPPLPGTGLALRGVRLLTGLLRCLCCLLPLIFWLRIFFCHNCQTD
jgi:hypothetical protein